MSRIAIVAALEREVRPLVKSWRVSEREFDGRRFRFFEKDDVVLVCGGIGAQAARRAAEAVISLYAPQVVSSVGFAGALGSELKVADIIQPLRVVNASDCSSVTLARGEGVLVTLGSVASPEQKAKLRDSFAAQAVDMEAAAVARAAEARGVRFAVVKVISDEFDFNLPAIFPSTERFVDANGQFLEGRFAWFAAFRPWLWPQIARLARNSGRASRALCDWLSDEGLRRLDAASTSTSSPGSTSSDTPTLQAVNRPVYRQ
jgi:adenosylhomocysteine nucleosidase